MFQEIVAAFPRFDTYASLFPDETGALSRAMKQGMPPLDSRIPIAGVVSSWSLISMLGRKVFVDVITFCAKAIKFLRKNYFGT